MTLECLPSNLSLAVNWQFEIDGSLFPLLGGDLVDDLGDNLGGGLSKRDILFSRRVISEFPYHQITLDHAEVADSGVYRCSIVPPIPLEDKTVTVLPGQ